MESCTTAIQGLVKTGKNFTEGIKQRLTLQSKIVKNHQDIGIETDGKLSEPKEDASAVQSPPKKKLRKNSPTGYMFGWTNMRSSGAKLMDKIMSCMEEGFMKQLEGQLVAKASEIVNASEFRACLVHLNALEKTDIQLTRGSKYKEVQWTEYAIKAVCSKKAIGSLVLALQSSCNELVLVETYEWLETFQAKTQNNPTSVKSLSNQSEPSAAGIFAATSKGLIAWDLKTSEATTVTSKATRAVAVNHVLNKVYWVETYKEGDCCRIMRSNFDGSAKEIIVPWTGDLITMMAINEATGDVYFVLDGSREITVCYALDLKCATFISGRSIVSQPVDAALDSKRGFMYLADGKSWRDSIVRANLDGRNATIISNGFASLSSIALDQRSNATDVLYWLDTETNTIGTMDFNGGSKRVLVELEDSQNPYGIQVDANKIYFSGLDDVQSVDRYSGGELTTVCNFSGAVYHIALVYVPLKKIEPSIQI